VNKSKEPDRVYTPMGQTALAPASSVYIAGESKVNVDSVISLIDKVSNQNQ